MVVAPTPTPTPTPPPVPTPIPNPASGYVLSTETGPRNTTLHVLQIDPKQAKFFVSPQVGLLKTSDALAKYGLKACWNGDGFSSPTGMTLGTWASNGQVYQKNTVEDTLYIDKNNVFTIYPRPAALLNAVSFPNRLITDGVVNASLEATSITPRTAFGWNSTNVYMVVCDGNEKTGIGMTKPEIANYMLALGCVQAINFDGGGSSALAVQGQGLVSAPNDEGQERAVANHVGFFIGNQVPTPIPTPTPTPNPTPTPTPTPTPVPSIKFDAFDGEFAPKLGVYEVGPLTEQTLEKLSDYAVKSMPTHYFPATLFGKYRTPGKVALDFSYVADNIINLLLSRINTTQATNYLNSYPDGCNFSSGMRVTVFPGNTVNIIDSAFRNTPANPPQWFVRIDCLPADANLMKTIDPASIPPYQLQHQSDVRWDGTIIAGKDLMGYDAILPLVAPVDTTEKTKLVSVPIWIQACALKDVVAQPN
jgi:hypothetical protein